MQPTRASRWSRPPPRRGTDLRGFEGSPERWRPLWAALEELDAVFPSSAEKGHIDPWGIVYPEDEVLPKQTDLVVRKWKHKRLRMPLAELAVEAREQERALRKEAARSYTGDEVAALERFCSAALAAALATPPEPPREWTPDAITEVLLASLPLRGLGSEPEPEPNRRPPARHPRQPLPYVARATRPRAMVTASADDVLAIAAAFELDVAPLLDAWLADDHPFAVEHLIRAAEGRLDDPPWNERSRTRLADGLAALFFREPDPAAGKRLSAAEKRVREQLPV